MADETTVRADGDSASPGPPEPPAGPLNPAEPLNPAQPQEPPTEPTPPASPPPLWRDPGLLRFTRWCATVLWLFAFGHDIYENGVPYYRSDLLLWLSIGLVATSIGKRAIWTVAVDFVPFAAVLIAYDYLRGISDTLGMPTWWHPQIDIDKFLFGGTEPTVWLQEHIKYPQAQWWDVAVTLTYISFFFLPYLTACILWMRSRAQFRQWAGRFITLSFVGFGFFALIPAAPPWAAASCTSAQVASHPSSPTCLGYSPEFTGGGMLGKVTHQLHGANPWVERISGRGFGPLHLHFASAVIKTGQSGVDLVAAVPSLHAGGTMLFVIFFWKRSNKWVRGLLAFYAVFMGFALVYSAEHFVSDVLAGWICAFAVSAAFDWFERRRSRSRAVDTLEGVSSHRPADRQPDGEPETP